MKNIFSKIKDKFNAPKDTEEEGEEEFVELNSAVSDDTKTKIVVRPFVVEDFADIKEILDSLREGYTIALINIKPLKDKDMIELKRAVSKLKKTCDAIEGDIAGFGEDWIVITPSFGEIYRNKQVSQVKED
jgi:SepF-like predicted cell division protein (DUF552 family)